MTHAVMAPSEEQSGLVIHNLDKSFAAPVLSNVNLTVAPGEVHAVVGENGAGKTTLGGILAGFLHKDGGKMMLDGVEYAPSGPRDAFAAGVSCATQELSLIDTLSVAENISLRKLPHACSVIARKTLEDRARALLKVVGLETLDPGAQVETLSLAERQLLELAKSISMDCKALILDEPTAALTAQQAAHLHKLIAELAASGVAVVYISHRLRDVLEVSDTVTVLRDGRVATTAPASALSVSALMEYMSGQTHSEHDQTGAVHRSGDAPVLEVVDITTGELPHEISLACHAGEIIGVAGLSGSGRSELLNALFGLTPLTGGHISRRSARGKIHIRNPETARTAGMAYLGEDRQSMGLYPGHSVLTNMMVPGKSHGSVSSALLDNRREMAAGRKLVDALAIKCDGLEQDMEQLSGGNQQKILLARWLHCDSTFFLLDEPTRGIDVGARNIVHDLMFELRDAGKTLIVASSEIEELVTLSDRILVLSNRKPVGIFTAADCTEAEILAACFSEFSADLMA